MMMAEPWYFRPILLVCPIADSERFDYDEFTGRGTIFRTMFTELGRAQKRVLERNERPTVMMRIVLIFLLLCTPAYAHDPSHPELNEWFNRLASGKGLCCSFRGPMDRRSRRCRNHRAKPCWQNYGLALHGRWRGRFSDTENSVLHARHHGLERPAPGCLFALALG